MFICIDQRKGTHTEGFETLDEAQAKLLELQREARHKGKTCEMIIIEVDDAETLAEDEFTIY